MTTKNSNRMYELEEVTEIIGAHCSLLVPYKGYTEGTVVGDYGNKIVEYRDEVIIYD